MYFHNLAEKTKVFFVENRHKLSFLLQWAIAKLFVPKRDTEAQYKMNFHATLFRFLRTFGKWGPSTLYCAFFELSTGSVAINDVDLPQHIVAMHQVTWEGECELFF